MRNQTRTLKCTINLMKNESNGKKLSMHADKCHSAYMSRKSKMQKSNKKNEEQFYSISTDDLNPC